MIAQDLSNKPENSQILAKIDDSLILYLLKILNQINTGKYFSEPDEAHFGVQLEIQIIRVLNLLALNKKNMFGLREQFAEFVQLANSALRDRFSILTAESENCVLTRTGNLKRTWDYARLSGQTQFCPLAHFSRVFLVFF